VYADHAIAPARVDAARLQQALYQELLQQILLQVDEGRMLVPGFGQQVEGVQQPVAQVDLAQVPDYTLRQRALGTAQAVEYFQRALREADRAAAFGQRRLFVEQHAVDTVLCEIDRRAQTNWAGADDDHRVFPGSPRSQLRRFSIGE